MKVVDIAKICHQANKAYCESLGDTSQLDWEDAPDNIKRSVIDGVAHKLANPDITPEQGHENWLKFKRADGWTYDKVKDPIAKTHPCLVDYCALPESQKMKDIIFTSIVSACSM